MELEKWFKLKKYPHIGFPITIKDYSWVKEYVENPINIKKHSFLPLIHKSIIQRKFRADTSIPSRNPSGKRVRKKGVPKVRDIYFSAHLDSIIISKYNEILYDSYEKYIQNKDFNQSIVAYRKIPISPDSNKNSCNIDFAKTSFEFIKDNSTKKLTVIIADVTSFFDNLNHKILKKQWTKVLGKKSLPDDHYNLFKTLTNIKYVESDQLFDAYGNTMWVETGVPNSSTEKVLKRKAIKDSMFFKEKNAVAYCDKKEFLKNNLNLIINKNNDKGIPQGSPISATLANIYMLEFDELVFNKISSINGFYQRYSDDLIIVCEQEYEDEIIKFLRDEIDALTKLEIQPSKTKVYQFEELKGKFIGFQIDELSKVSIYIK